MRLNQIADKFGARQTRIRVGRGIGSGKGKTAGRGHKGQKARTGVRIKGFEGGQMPMHRRLPKRGFNVPNPSVFEIVNLAGLQGAVEQGRIDAAKPVTIEALTNAGLVGGRGDGVKLLGNGELKSKLTIEVSRASKSAQTAVEKAGGSIKLLAPFVKVERKLKKKSKAKAKLAESAKAESAKAESAKTESVKTKGAEAAKPGAAPKAD